MIFKCPVCGDIHRVNDNYDNSDFICLNSANRVNQKIFQDIVPEDQLTKNAYNFNTGSTLEDAGRPATVMPKKHQYKRTGQKVNIDKKNY